MSESAPPEGLGASILTLQISPDGKGAPLVPRVLRAFFVGAVFSILPVALTNLILTEEGAGFDPRALMAAIPVWGTAFWIMRPRERWYAVGEEGFAVGESFFGQVRWEKLIYTEMDSVEISTREQAQGTAYRYVFVGGRTRIVLEGEIRAADSNLEATEEFPPELRVASTAQQAWEKATGRGATYPAEES